MFVKRIQIKDDESILKPSNAVMLQFNQLNLLEEVNVAYLRFTFLSSYNILDEIDLDMSLKIARVENNSPIVEENTFKNVLVVLTKCVLTVDGGFLWETILQRMKFALIAQKNLILIR